MAFLAKLFGKKKDNEPAEAALVEEEGLTPEEEIERAALRREYIDSVVGNLKGHLDNTYFVEADGTKTKLKKKGEEK